MNENDIGTVIVDTAIAIHKELGPGLLESVYEIVLERALIEKGLSVQRQVPIQITWRGHTFEEGFRADMIANEIVLLELKSLTAIDNSHRKQLLTYLRLSGIRLGYLLNFGSSYMKDGICRVINGAPDLSTFLRDSATPREA